MGGAPSSFPIVPKNLYETLSTVRTFGQCFCYTWSSVNNTGGLLLKQTLTAKLQIFPNSSDSQVLSDTMGTYSAACSFVSAQIRTASIPLSHRCVHDAVYRDCRSSFSLPSQMAESVIRTVISAIRSIRTNQERHPEKFKKNKQKEIFPVFRASQLSLVWNRDYSLIRNKKSEEYFFSINTLNGRIRVPFRSDAMEWAFTEGAKFGTAQLVHKHGKFFLHIPVTVEVRDTSEFSDYSRIVGIDRGIRFLTVSYDGEKTSFASGKTVKQKRAHFKALRQDLQKKQTSSARRRLRAIGERENRWMNDVNHCLSKALVLNNPEGTLFVLEDLTGIRSATERIRVKDRYVSVSWPYYDLEQKLSYKAVRNDSYMIKVDPAYTSQTCPLCGHRDRKNRDKGTHTFCCRKCGYRTNDDRVAAMNLQRMGREYLLKAQALKENAALQEHAPADGVQSITPRCAASSAVSAAGCNCFQNKVGDATSLTTGQAQAREFIRG